MAIDIKKFIDENSQGNFYSYEGSVEGITGCLRWVVFEEPILIAPEDAEIFEVFKNPDSDPTIFNFFVDGIPNLFPTENRQIDYYTDYELTQCPGRCWYIDHGVCRPDNSKISLNCDEPGRIKANLDPCLFTPEGADYSLGNGSIYYYIYK